MTFYKKLTIPLMIVLSLNTAWSSKYEKPELESGDTSLTTRSVSYFDGLSSFVRENIENVSNHLSQHPLESLALSTSLILPYLPLDTYLGEGATNMISLTIVGVPLALSVLKDKTLSMGSKVLFLTGGLVVSNAVPTAAAAFSGAGVCDLPGGSYLGSCHNATVAPYTSTDPHVPSSCVLTTTCDSTHTAIDGTPNTLYFGSQERFTLGNNNGTIVVQSIGGKRTYGTSSSSPMECTPLPGSFSETCTTTSAPYVSTDTNLAGTTLCEMETHCETLRGSRTGGVVHYPHQGVTTVVENCDGVPVLHPDSTHDHECSGVSGDEIKAIVSRK